MNWWETLRTGLEAVRTHRLRSALTMLGILIGIAAVILTVGLGEGAQEKVRNQINALGSNLLIVSPGSSDEQHRHPRRLRFGVDADAARCGGADEQDRRPGHQSRGADRLDVGIAHCRLDELDDVGRGNPARLARRFARGRSPPDGSSRRRDVSIPGRRRRARSDDRAGALRPRRSALGQTVTSTASRCR